MTRVMGLRALVVTCVLAIGTSAMASRDYRALNASEFLQVSSIVTGATTPDDDEDFELDLKQLQKYYDAAVAWEKVKKEGKSKDETDADYAKRLKAAVANVAKNGQPLVDALVKHVGKFGSDVQLPMGNSEELVIYFANKVTKDKKTAYDPKAKAIIKIESKDGKVIDYEVEVYTADEPKKKD